jgi:hypothetical protein
LVEKVRPARRPSTVDFLTFIYMGKREIAFPLRGSGRAGSDVCARASLLAQATERKKVNFL